MRALLASLPGCSLAVPVLPTTPESMMDPALMLAGQKKEVCRRSSHPVVCALNAKQNQTTSYPSHPQPLQGKKEEFRRIRDFVDCAYRQDPR